jgi:hypothetical protein
LFLADNLAKILDHELLSKAGGHPITLGALFGNMLIVTKFVMGCDSANVMGIDLSFSQPSDKRDTAYCTFFETDAEDS